MDGDQGFILLPLQTAVLPRSDAGSDGVELAQCFLTFLALVPLKSL